MGLAFAKNQEKRYLMKFDQVLHSGILEKRYKRFLADVKLENGEMITAHCPNSGSMLGLKDPGLPVLLSVSSNPKRKLPYGLEMVQVNGSWVGVNTQLPNHIVQQAIESQQISELQGYENVQREVVYKPGTRLDLYLSGGDSPPCYVEVKSVTMKQGNLALFPDAVTTRGLKHLKTLEEIVQKGGRAVAFYLVQRGDCAGFGIARDIDPDYAAAFKLARAAGVEVLCYACDLSPNEITLSHKLPIEKD